MMGVNEIDDAAARRVHARFVRDYPESGVPLLRLDLRDLDAPLSRIHRAEPHLEGLANLEPRRIPRLRRRSHRGSRQDTARRQAHLHILCPGGPCPSGGRAGSSASAPSLCRLQ